MRTSTGLWLSLLGVGLVATGASSTAWAQAGITSPPVQQGTQSATDAAKKAMDQERRQKEEEAKKKAAAAQQQK
jgi:hypothetical protein